MWMGLSYTYETCSGLEQDSRQNQPCSDTRTHALNGYEKRLSPTVANGPPAGTEGKGGGDTIMATGGVAEGVSSRGPAGALLVGGVPARAARPGCRHTPSEQLLEGRLLGHLGRHLHLRPGFDKPWGGLKKHHQYRKILPSFL